MQHVFGTVIWVVVGLAVLAAVIALISARRTWDDYGSDHLLAESDFQRGPSPGSIGALQERDTDIRELLEARNALRARRGEPPVDVEAELAKLTAPAIDPALRDEIRDLVIARNVRRARAGKPPLDIEAEIEREIAGLRDL